MNTVKKSALKIFFFIILVSLSTLLFFSANSGSDEVVRINSGGFFPQKITVPQGSAVNFVNKDKEPHWPAANDHPVHLSLPEFDPQRPILSDSKWEFTFDQVGRFAYHDHLNPELTGEIEVVNTADFKKRSWIEGISFPIKNFMQTRNPEQKAAEKSVQIPEFACQKDEFTCVAEYLEQLTEVSGPQQATKRLHELQQQGKVSPSVDEHQLSHRIGRRTAAAFGISAESFLTCPMADFNGGCQHGYFEFALGETPTTKEAAETICESMVGKYSSKDHFYCYHGVGHGVMMAKAYNVAVAVQECEKLGTTTGVNGCLQGAFMESGNALLRGELPDKDPTNPVGSCTGLEDRYQRECLINLSGYIVTKSGMNFDKAIKQCLSVKTADAKEGCLIGLGLMVTNPAWQVNFFPAESSLSFTEKSKQLCEKFPAEYKDDCVISGVANIQNFDNLSLSRAKDFCDAFVNTPLQQLCYTHMAQNVKNMAVNTEQIKTACQSLQNNFTALCLKESVITD